MDAWAVGKSVAFRFKGQVHILAKIASERGTQSTPTWTLPIQDFSNNIRQQLSSDVPGTARRFR